MSLFAIGLVCLSAFLHALKSLFIKKSFDKWVFVWWNMIAAQVVYFPLFLFFVLSETLPVREIFIWGSLSGIAHFFYVLFLARSYDTGDLSQVYPIMRSAPAAILILAFIFLGEQVSWQGALGILSIVGGVYIINMKTLSFQNLLLPLRSLFVNPATRYAFLTMLSVAIYSVIDKLGAEQIHPVIFTYLITTFTLTLYSPYIFLTKKISTIKEEWLLNKKPIIITGTISTGGYLLIIIALTMEKVSYVAGLRQLSVIFAVLMGSHLLKEEGKFVRLLAAFAIFIGAFLVALAE